MEGGWADSRPESFSAPVSSCSESLELGTRVGSQGGERGAQVMAQDKSTSDGTRQERLHAVKVGGS